ncbi:MAG: ATP-binding cassette domain-containing protein [Bacteroidota bacterium]|nr:ATP-binding cassette domain-containing protein [Bacteroidota bacterium]
MSEEVLKALMQLFAIIANQDGGSDDIHNDYVKSFLKSQISDDRINEFFEYYKSFIKVGSEVEEQKRTSMKDSVRTLSICKKINKTLNQKQKIIVFARLHEFILQDDKESGLRAEILKTVAEVFNISKEEYRCITLAFSTDYSDFTNDFILVSDEAINEFSGKRMKIAGFPGTCLFHYVRESNIIFFLYRGENEINLNGLAVKSGRINVFSPGSSIRHARGTLFYSDVISNFLDETFESTVYFYSEIKTHNHPNGKIALRDISISEKSGTLLGVMGASGSGKTTLLNVLSGTDKVTDGIIRINGCDIHDATTNVNGVIGFIPQDDLLIEELTVYQNLFLNAKLCFKDISEKELSIKVMKLLSVLGLKESKNIKVGSPLNKKISGGQRKRLNIALELIREPQVLFVDEPTSGLSSRDSENVMDLLKELSHKGKLIFVVIHQPSSDIYKLFDKIFLLDTGGYPVYYGNPIEALLYFKKTTNQVNSNTSECHSCGSVNPELIFNLIEAKEIDEYGNYVQKRKINPEGWYGLYRKNFLRALYDPGQVFEKIKKAEIPAKIKQWWIFLTRDSLSKISNKQYILINLLEVPVLALFLALLIRYINRPSGESTYSYYNNENIPAFFFMTIIVALLVGLTVSAEEIFKDQKILKREKFLHLSRLSYLFSKVLILFIISAIQSFILCLVGVFVLEIPGDISPFFIIIFSIFCSANLMGLVLSSTFNSPVTIYIIIPLIIIPQMLLGGAMFKFSKLNELLGGGNNKVPTISNLMVTRWAYEGIVVNTFETNKYEKEIFEVDKQVSKYNYRVSYLIPKIDELVELRTKLDSATGKQKRIFLSHLISNTISKEFAASKDENHVIKVGEGEDSLEAMKNFFIIKYNFILDKNEEEEARLKKRNIRKKMYTNKNLEEQVTNALEKNKILVDSTGFRLIQIIDPIFKDPPKSAHSIGLDAHFFSPQKFIFGKEISTFLYNLCMIWILNLIAFILLYFDSMKKLIQLFSFFKNPLSFFSKNKKQ